tara:strand:- start:6401 stop:6571 length:171 start_codon:yes stop_codon:yes gene_type:complete
MVWARFCGQVSHGVAVERGGWCDGCEGVCGYCLCVILGNKKGRDGGLFYDDRLANG